MSDQLPLFGSPAGYGSDRARRPAYVRQGQERPADIPKLERSAETMEARVLAWFKARSIRDIDGSLLFVAFTPTQCAEGLGVKLTTARPRICQLAKRTEGPRLERCKWLSRRPTEGGGSEGFFRYTEGDSR